MNIEEQITFEKDEAIIHEGVTLIDLEMGQALRRVDHIRFPSCIANVASSAFANNEHLFGTLELSVSGRLDINHRAFYCMKKLQGVHIKAKGDLYLGEDAFAGCDLLENVFLESEEGGVYVGIDAFCDCASLKKLSIHGPCRLDKGAFNKVPLEEIDIPEPLHLGEDSLRNTKIAVFPGLSKAETLRTNCLTGTLLEEVDLSSAEGSVMMMWLHRLKKVILGPKVTTLEPGSFRNCEELEEIFLPKNIRSIGSYSFARCPKLQRVILEEGSPLGYNDGFLFQDKTLVRFLNSHERDEILVPKEIEIFDSGCFHALTRVRKVAFEGATFSTMKPRAFLGCVGIQSIAFPGERYHLRDRCIYDNDVLVGYIIAPQQRVVKIPDGVTTLGDGFDGLWPDVEEVFVPDSVTRIEPWAFGLSNHTVCVPIPHPVTGKKFAKRYGAELTEFKGYLRGLSSEEIEDRIARSGLPPLTDEEVLSLTAIKVADNHYYETLTRTDNAVVQEPGHTFLHELRSQSFPLKELNGKPFLLVGDDELRAVVGDRLYLVDPKGKVYTSKGLGYPVDCDEAGFTPTYYVTSGYIRYTLEG